MALEIVPEPAGFAGSAIAQATSELPSSVTSHQNEANPVTMETAGLEDLVGRVATLATPGGNPDPDPDTILPTLTTEPTTQAPRPDVSPSLFGDCPSSGGSRQIEDESLFDLWEPIRTYNGIKWVPTVTRRGNCTGCPVYALCAADVADGDFAWCEQVTPADYQLTNPKRTAYRNYELAT